jgi:hypothetical protein
MKKNYLILFTFHCLTIALFSQVQEEWISRYNFNQNTTYQQPYKVKYDNIGNIYVAGYVIKNSLPDDWDYLLLKYNTNGVLLWTVSYDGPAHGVDELRSMALDNQGNIYVTGTSMGSNSSQDFCTIKYNPAGEMLWQSRYSSESSSGDQARDLAVDNFGNTYVTGSTNINIIVTVKYDVYGVQEWVSSYTNNHCCNFSFAVTVDDFGNSYIAGGEWEGGANEYKNYISIMYNPQGIQVWRNTYGQPQFDEYANQILLDGSRNVYISGPGVDKSYIIKYNNAGIRLWANEFLNGRISAFKVDNFENVYVTGEVQGKMTTIKYNSNGALIWDATYTENPTNSSSADDLVLDNEGNVYIAGLFQRPETYQDYGILKYSSSGKLLWVKSYNGSGNNLDWAHSITLDNNKNVYVTGRSGNSLGYADIVTIKYNQLIGIQPISNEIPNQFSLSQNYPNPFNPITKIKFTLPKSSFVTVVVYDAPGREIETIVNEQLNPGTYETDWNALNYPSGIYYYKLNAENYTDTKKMVLIK